VPTFKALWDVILNTVCFKGHDNIIFNVKGAIGDYLQKHIS